MATAIQQITPATTIAQALSGMSGLLYPRKDNESMRKGFVQLQKKDGDEHKTIRALDVAAFIMKDKNSKPYLSVNMCGFAHCNLFIANGKFGNVLEGHLSGDEKIRVVAKIPGRKHDAGDLTEAEVLEALSKKLVIQLYTKGDSANRADDHPF